MEAIAAATAARLRAGTALISVVTVTELMVGARDRAAEAGLTELIGRLPAVAVDRDIAERAGRMGRVARARGMTLPLPDLAIAATAAHLGVPLLTCDADFARGAALARNARRTEAWHGFELDAASIVG
jgi:predicted nucleic acid-binding protein